MAERAVSTQRSVETLLAALVASMVGLGMIVAASGLGMALPALPAVEVMRGNTVSRDTGAADTWGAPSASAPRNDARLDAQSNAVVESLAPTAPAAAHHPIAPWNQDPLVTSGRLHPSSSHSSADLRWALAEMARSSREGDAASGVVRHAIDWNTPAARSSPRRRPLPLLKLRTLRRRGARFCLQRNPSSARCRRRPTPA